MPVRMWKPLERKTLLKVLVCAAVLDIAMASYFYIGDLGKIPLFPEARSTPTVVQKQEFHKETYSIEPEAVYYSVKGDWKYFDIDDSQVGFNSESLIMGFGKDKDFVGKIIPTVIVRTGGAWWLCPLKNPNVTASGKYGGDYEKTMWYAGYRNGLCYQYGALENTMTYNVTIDEISLRCDNSGKCKLTSNISFPITPQNTGMGYFFEPENASRFGFVDANGTAINVSYISKYDWADYRMTLKETINETEGAFGDLAFFNWKDMLYPTTSDDYNISYDTMLSFFEVMEYGNHLGLLLGTGKYGAISNFYIDPTYTVSNVSANASFDQVIHKNVYTHLNMSIYVDSTYLPFDVENQSSTVYDWGNKGYDGTIYGATWTSDGMYGGAYSFDGVNDRISFTNTEDAYEGDNFTVAFWMYSNYHTAAHRFVVSKERYGGTFENWYFYHRDSDGSNADKLIFVVENGSVEVTADSNDVVSTGAWHHIAGVRNTTHVLLYVDGVLQSDMPKLTNSNEVQDNLICIGTGRCATPEAYWFNGTVDEFMIINRSLTSAEISSIYHGEYERFHGYGNQTLRPINISDQNNNRVNVTIEHANQNGTNTNLGVKVAYYNFSTEMDNLKLYVPGDFESSKVWDISGNGHQGSTSSGAYHNSSCFNDTGCYEFKSGANDKIKMGLASEFLPVNSTRPFTMAAWMYRRDSDIQYDAFLGASDSSSHLITIGYGYPSSDYEPTAYIWNGATNTIIDCNLVNIELNTWHHVALTTNGTVAKIYVDGKYCTGDDTIHYSIGEMTGDSVYLSAAISTYIPDGAVDEAMIWNDTELTATQIQQLYEDTNYKRHMFTTAEQNLTSEVETEYTIDGEADFIYPIINYYSESNQHWSPILLDNMTLETWNETGAAPADNPPAVTLVSPGDASSTTANYTFFNCTATDDNDLVNISLYHNGTGSWALNYTNSTTGTWNFSSNNVTIEPRKTIVWNCLAYDDAAQTDWGDANYTFDVSYPSVGDTCDTCTIDCTEGCTVDSELDCGGDDLVFTGSGMVWIDAAIKNFGDVKLSGGCKIVCSGGYCFI